MNHAKMKKNEGKTKRRGINTNHLRKEFESLRREYEKNDRLRDDLIRKSRNIIKLSKRIIYSVHRGDLKEAGKSVKNIKESIKEIKSLTKSKISDVGYLRNAFQEYVEALCFYDYVKNKTIPQSDELGVDTDSYLLGICDLTGELMRYATNSFLKGKFDIVLEVKLVMESIYNELMLFDFRNSEIRQKFDSIKYSLKKLNDLAIEIMKRGE